MISIHAHFDGTVIVPHDPVDLPRDQALIVRIEPVPEPERPSEVSCLDWLAENAVENVRHMLHFFFLREFLEQFCVRVVQWIYATKEQRKRSKWLLQDAIDDAEKALIEKYHPCVNQMNNQTQTPLPSTLHDFSEFSTRYPSIATAKLDLDRQLLAVLKKNSHISK